jgi:hypothetical protein
VIDAGEERYRRSKWRKEATEENCLVTMPGEVYFRIRQDSVIDAKHLG